MPKNQTSFKKNNLARQKHGGAAAEKRLRTNEELTGLAKEVELQALEELRTNNGRYALVERNTARLQAVSELYWNALIDAGERGNTKELASYAKTYGWLAGKALGALQQLREEQASLPPTVDYERILEAKDKE